jgi:NADH:ubiquinone oxidoreductase subunit 5 (subunit L)/multisubunit Na+/H+ antiporter MnhA subunit
VAQIGYLFVMFPLAAGLAGNGLDPAPAENGGLLQAISHAMAKAAMFMAAGLIYRSIGHDRIAELGGAARAMPVTLLTFALAGVALMGLPPGGAWVAKKLFFDATAATGQWWWEIVLNAGAFLTASYTVLVLAHALRPAATPITLKAPVSRVSEFAALVLALGSLLLGFAAERVVPGASLSKAFELSELLSAVVVILGGAALACAFGLRLPAMPVGDKIAELLRPLRRATVAASGLVVRADGALREWPIASLALLMLAIALGAAIAAD